MNPDEFPGALEARAWEASTRAEAFLDVPRTLLGVEVLPLTLHRLGLLTAARNALLCGGPVTLKQVTDFLWVLAPAFLVGSSEAYALFCRELGERGGVGDLPACAGEVGKFLDEMFLDAPAGGTDSLKVPVTCPEAVYVDLFADAYGWTAAETMHTPLPRLYQLLRRIVLRRDPKAIFINRHFDKVRGDWLRAATAAAQAANSCSEPVC